MRTFDKKDIFSWANAKEAKAYIGKGGSDFSRNIKARLAHEFEQSLIL